MTEKLFDNSFSMNAFFPQVQMCHEIYIFNAEFSGCIEKSDTYGSMPPKMTKDDKIWNFADCSCQLKTQMQVVFFPTNQMMSVHLRSARREDCLPCCLRICGCILHKHLQVSRYQITSNSGLEQFRWLKNDPKKFKRWICTKMPQITKMKKYNSWMFSLNCHVCTYCKVSKALRVSPAETRLMVYCRLRAQKGSIFICRERLNNAE